MVLTLTYRVLFLSFTVNTRIESSKQVGRVGLKNTHCQTETTSLISIVNGNKRNVIMSKERSYTISAVTEQDVEPVMNLLKRTFYVDEPLNRTVGLCPSETDPCPELDEYCKSSILEGLSFKATDNDGNVIGAMINGICPLKEDDNGNDLLSQAQRCPNPKFQKIIYILARRESGAKLWDKFPHDQKLVEVKVAATDYKWRKKGIMNALTEETEKTIKERGIRLLRLDTSSAYSAKTAERYGFTCYYRALYKDIKMNGQPLIVPEPPHLYDSVYVKELFPLSVTQ